LIHQIFKLGFLPTIPCILKIFMRGVLGKLIMDEKYTNAKILTFEK